MLNLLPKIHPDQIQASPTRVIVNDYFRFVTGFFEVISTSAPHIYHSALLLSPRTSVVRKLHDSYTRPMVRVVRGLPDSWEPVVATQRHHDFDSAQEVAWSPCGRLIAVAWIASRTIEVMDAVTLERLDTFEHPEDRTEWLSFSQDSRSITRFGLHFGAHYSDDVWGLSSWDLQTGGPIGSIHPELHRHPEDSFSSTHSMDGKMVAVACRPWVDANTTTTISTYNLISRTHAYSHRVSEGHIVAPIWTHGECLRFATAKPGYITIWEAGFTSICTLAEVESFPAPDGIKDSKEHLFLPSLFRLAFTPQNAVLVWDVRDSKYLLNFMGIHPTKLSFSTDGRFLACGATSHEVYLWKESPTGYTLHQRVAFNIHRYVKPLLSPNGESIIAFSQTTIQLWNTTDPTPSLSSVQTQFIEPSSYIMDFSPDKTLAVVAPLEGNIATVLDLKSGDPRLIIDTGMKVLCLRITGSTIVVVGEGKVITWNLPAAGGVLNARANVNDSVRTTTFDYLPPCFIFPRAIPVLYTSISPDLNRIAVAERSVGLSIYDVATGKHLAHDPPAEGPVPWFTPDGRDVWCAGYLTRTVEGWSIIEDSETDLVRLEPLGPTAHPSGGPPWRSSLGYEITPDGWALNPSGKRLLWLPHHWRLPDEYRVWGGRFLGLLHHELPEPVILELGE